MTGGSETIIIINRISNKIKISVTLEVRVKISNNKSHNNKNSKIIKWTYFE